MLVFNTVLKIDGLHQKDIFVVHERYAVKIFCTGIIISE